MSGGTSNLTVKRTLIEVTCGQVEANRIMLANTANVSELRDVQITATNSGYNYGVRHIEGPRPTSAPRACMAARSQRP